MVVTECACSVSSACRVSVGCFEECNLANSAWQLHAVTDKLLQPEILFRFLCTIECN